MPTNRQPILEVVGLRKSFGPTEVLRGIDLAVAPRELVFVIGPSGSGKSTLLRCCNRLEEPTGGEVRIEGENICAPGVDINRVRQRIGFVFQSFNLYPHMNALGNVTVALRQVGLAEKAKSYPSELSGGQQQRVAIARALALEPHILLFDEPTSALDPELVGSVLQVMRELRDSGMTMVVVSHELSFARAAANRVVFMDHGQIVETAPPREFFTSPRNERTKLFLSQILSH